MDSREISIWLDRRWYAALSKHLDGGTVEDQLSSYLNKLISQLPKEEHDQISREIQGEDLRLQQEIEAAKKYVAFHVRENGQEEYFQLQSPRSILNAAQMLRSYLRADRQDSFPDFCGIRQRITAAEFDRLVGVHLENPQKVTGAFALDFDKKEFSSANAVDGWHTYPMRDVSSAIYHANRSVGLTSRQRMARFTERLADKEIASAGHLSARQVSFAEEISEIDGRLNFYMETNFDVDAMFGTHVCTDQNDDSLNVYTALRLREYLATKDSSSARFAQAIPAADAIAPEVFREYADEMRQDAGRVIAALDIDLDRDTISTMAGADGWQTYSISNVLKAAWKATLTDYIEWNERRCIFADQLEDKLIAQDPTGIMPPAGPVM